MRDCQNTNQNPTYMYNNYFLKIESNVLNKRIKGPELSVCITEIEMI